MSGHHSGRINVPVDVEVSAGGAATRDGLPAPTQKFSNCVRGQLRRGDLLLNPGAMTVHRVLEVDAESVMISTAGGPLVVAWGDLIAAVWQVTE